MPNIVRLTLFKLPDAAVVQEAIQKYSTLSQDANQDGKPYVQLSAANRVHDDPRSQGFTLLTRTVFESKEDMDFYDNEDDAHKAIKALIKPKITEMPLVVYSDMV
ncbi:hypothetical protein T440DRAFT_466308 [Plenodomus tracheiphilus IPT5]|uniref:Stress-response A/B barrel domain-containing protein n=1 Tax=Plenodomus tracheiphilus IPT5 TaxID=1408161 RepID=A0A6A7BDI2_9PLEO|nr:hypothetical protein T440DRAFT_466308 [Plenodomus tracheiphilus IPT5]